MGRVYSENIFGSCKISLEDWEKPLVELPKGRVYLIGSFRHRNVVTLVYYKDGVFYFADKASTQRADYYNFPNLQRAYAYFEQMFYGRGDM